MYTWLLAGLAVKHWLAGWLAAGCWLAAGSTWLAGGGGAEEEEEGRGEGAHTQTDRQTHTHTLGWRSRTKSVRGGDEIACPQPYVQARQ